MSVVVAQKPRSTFWVNADNNTVNQIGTVTGPFQTITAAVTAALAAGPQANVIIRCDAGDYSAQDFTLPQGVGWVIEGPGSGTCFLGNMTWQSTGNGTSSLTLRNVQAKSLTCEDGPGGPATKALLGTEDCVILGNVTATGTGNIPALISGLSTAASTISGPNVSAIVAGNISMPHSSVGLTNTQVGGTMASAVLWGRGCSFAGAITVSGSVELVASVALAAVSAASLTLDEYTYFRGVSFDGTPLVLATAAHIWRKFTFGFASFPSGMTTTKTVLAIPAKYIPNLVIAKTSQAWVGPNNVSFSVGITGTIGKYVSSYNGKTAVSDANFSSGLLSPEVPFSWVNPTNIILTAVLGAGAATAGSLDVWIQLSFLP